MSGPEEGSSSSSSSKGCTYDVFISFRGQDTRKNFTDHLCVALKEAGINAFIDGELRRGEDITTELVRAIQGSKISLIVFSRNYADSSSCLEELVTIMKSRKNFGQIVLPIFYKVEPSHVRKQSGTFAEAFLKHKGANKEVSWRDALTQAAHLSGYDLNNTLDGTKHKVLKVDRKFLKEARYAELLHTKFEK